MNNHEEMKPQDFWEQAFIEAYSEVDEFLLKYEDNRRTYPQHDLLGQGGVKRVHLSFDWKTNREVALALPLDETNSEISLNFIHEATVLGKLEHPHIIPVHDTGLNEDNVPYFTMKRVRGQDLETHCQQHAKAQGCAIGQTAALEIFKNICMAVSYAHSKDIVHLDIKPANVMLGNFGEVFLCDWGFSKELGGLDKKVRTTELHGTPGYFAPERLVDTDPAKTMDIYSLGCLLYYLLTGKAPIESTGVTAFIDELHDKGFDALNEADESSAPRSLLLIVAKCCQEDPADRYQEVAEVIEDLDLYVRGYAPKAEQAGAMKNLSLYYQRNAFRLNLIGAFILLIGAITIIYIRDLREKTRIAITEKEQATRLAESLDLKRKENQEFVNQLIETADRCFRLGRTDSARSILENILFMSLNADQTHLRLAKVHISDLRWRSARESLGRIETPTQASRALEKIVDEHAAPSLSPRDHFRLACRCADEGFVQLYENLAEDLMDRNYEYSLKPRHAMRFLRLDNPEMDDESIEYDSKTYRLRIHNSTIRRTTMLRHARLYHLAIESCQLARLPRDLRLRSLSLKNTEVAQPLRLDLSILQSFTLPLNKVEINFTDAPRLREIHYPANLYEATIWDNFHGEASAYQPDQPR